MTAISRRTLLGGLAGTAGGVTAIPLPAPAADTASVLTPPTRKELEHYYAFLWAEHCAVAEELGVDVMDSFVAHRSGGRDVYNQTCRQQPPSERAKAVLASAGFPAGG
ncbi:hypothetical protein [Ensifer sp. Root278]|uniref:hypothetical protein n=1 Tax=Ensifer sp. Root278 TaxID=1736509 RepID=UPI00070AC75F|nr:hypothetical protein [Ensifer sp. Root278]KRD49027.1 hypothetical protein ASE60_20980 [Ensifer sp. Root278]